MDTISTSKGDIEGSVYAKRTFRAWKAAQFLRVEGAYITAHATKESMPVVWDADLSGCTVSLVLRPNSIVINLRDRSKVWVTLDGKYQSVHDWVAALEKASKISFERDYTLGEKIGAGAFASVHRATATQSGEEVAVKVIAKHLSDTRSAREIGREIFACQSLRIPGVVGTRGVYQTRRQLFIVMDLIPGGTLKERVKKAGNRVGEVVVSQIVQATLTTLSTIHEAGFVHKDIKLENILCLKKSLPSETVICDFGCVQVLQPGAETMRSRVGTTLYIAPEMAGREPYGAKVDLWAMGVMTYRMICGKYPFDGGYDDDEGTLESIRTDEVSFSETECADVSPACKSFIRGLLEKSPAARPSAQQALKHEWIETAAKRKRVKIMPDRKDSPRSVLMPMTSEGILSPPTTKCTLSELEEERVRAVDAIGDRLARKLSELLRNPNSPSHQGSQSSSKERLHAQGILFPNSVRNIVESNADALAAIDSAPNTGSPVCSEECTTAVNYSNSRIETSKLTPTTEVTDAVEAAVERTQSQPLLAGNGQKPSRMTGLRLLLSGSLSSPRSGRSRTSRSSGRVYSTTKIGNVFGRRKNQENSEMR